MSKLLYITPHLSTGGAPQYLLKKIELLKDEYDISLVEYTDLGGTAFVVQKNKIFDLIPPKKRITLGEDKTQLLDFIDKIDPDIIHLEEIPELFMESGLAEVLYDKSRKYLLIETSHDSSQNPESKRFFPDKFMFVSQWQIDQYKDINVPSALVEYPIEYKDNRNKKEACKRLGLDPNKKHIIHVGLFTPRKNQAEFFEYAKALPEYEFHCIGNQAGNFKHYWEPLMENKPSNLTWWGERNDVDNFYEAADLFLFTSKGSTYDKETMPLVIREALAWKLPILIYNLEVYQNYFDKYSVEYLSNNKNNNIKNIKNMIEGFKIVSSPTTPEDFDISLVEGNKITFSYKKSEEFNCKVVVKEKTSNAPMYHFDALFKDYSQWWCIPNQGFNIEKSWVTELTLEFYTPEKEFLFSKDLFVKENGIKSDVRLEVKNPFDCLFHNFSEMFIDKKYDFLFDSKLDVVLDIGANAGTFSKLFLEKGANKVYAFEPVSEALINLDFVAANNPNLKVIKKAVHTDNDGLTFYVDSGNSTISSFDPEHVNYDHTGHIVKTEVPTITLKSFTHQEKLDKIDLIKIDIEGAEYNLLENLEDEIFDITDSILVEWHDNNDQRVVKLINKLESKGFTIDKIFDQVTNESLKDRDSHLNSVVGTIYATKLEKSSTSPLVEPKPILIVDAFFHDSMCLRQLREYLTSVKKLDIPIMLVTNSNFDSSLAEEFDYILYDSHNRLFENQYTSPKNIVFYYGNSDHYMSIGTPGLQKHGLSVLSNLYHTTNLAKSLGYTHFYRIEYDCKIDNIDAIKNIVSTVSSSNKKGLGYLNEGKYFSYQIWYMELEFFTNNFPQINNEDEYVQAISKWASKDWLSAEEFMYEMIRNSKEGVNSFLIKDSQLMHTDYGNCLWNTITTPLESDKIHKGTTAGVFRVTIPQENNPQPENCPVDNTKLALITWNISTEGKNSATYIVTYPDGSVKEFTHEVIGQNGSQREYIDLFDEDLLIEVTQGDNTQQFKYNKNTILQCDNVYHPYF